MVKDEEIGELSSKWNWLVGVYKEPENGHPKILHYTNGGPWFKDCRKCEYSEIWINEFNEMMKK